MRISAIIAEPLITNETVEPAEVRRRMLELLDLFGLPERSPISSRTNSPAASASASPSPARWSFAPAGGAGRAGLGARRLDPRPDPQPLRELQGGSACPTCSSPTTSPPSPT
jgi:hypothetical protein